MDSLAGPVAVAAGLLMLGGAPKAVRPDSTVRAIAAQGLRMPPVLLRGLGLIEVGIGVTVIGFGGRVPAALLAGSYAAFTVFVAVALVRRTPLATCGCFGRPDTPPTRTHLLVTGAAAGVGTLAAVDPLPGLPVVLTASPAAGVPLLALVGLALWLAYLTLAVLPTVPGKSLATGPAGARQ
jgi:hypothetical protein